MDICNVIRWHKWKKEWEEKRFKTDAWQQFFTETKNVWNDLPDMIMQWRIKYRAIEGNWKTSRGMWGTVSFEMGGAIKICLSPYVLEHTEILMLNLLLVVHSLDHHNRLSASTLSLVNHWRNSCG